MLPFIAMVCHRVMPHGAAPQSPSPRLSEDKPFTYLRHVEKQRHIYVSHAAVSRAAAVVSNNTHQRTNQASLQKRLHVKPAGSFIKNVFHVYTSSKTPIGILF